MFGTRSARYGQLLLFAAPLFGAGSAAARSPWMPRPHPPPRPPKAVLTGLSVLRIQAHPHDWLDGVDGSTPDAVLQDLTKGSGHSGHAMASTASPGAGGDPSRMLMGHRRRPGAVDAPTATTSTTRRRA